MRQRRRRIMAFGVVACWLLLNVQLALAAHLCDVPTLPQHSQVSSHHSAHTGQNNHTTVVAKGPLCEKHCTPDSAQKTASPLHLDALAPDSGTRLAIATPTPTRQEQGWLTPPRTGPPIEVVYCRYRE